MVDNSIQIEESWKNILSDEFEREYFQKIKKFLLEEMKSGKTIYPEWKDIFNAFNSTPFSNVKVVVIGQDPYHGPGQAHGLCFSVNRGVRTPPSLKNIYKELNSDLWLEIPTHGCLQKWTEQEFYYWMLFLLLRQGIQRRIELLVGRHLPIVWLKKFLMKKNE